MYFPFLGIIIALTLRQSVGITLGGWLIKQAPAMKPTQRGVAKVPQQPPNIIPSHPAHAPFQPHL